ncbi:hypothetical protein KAH37_08910 [bacterium]|nr:hypothetical protein [bacterium]
MNGKIKYIIPSILFIVVAIYLAKDIYFAQSDIQKNSDVIEKLSATSKQGKETVHRTKEQIKEFNTNPKAAERLLRERYDIIRKDQFIIRQQDDADDIDNRQEDGNNDKNN